MRVDTEQGKEPIGSRIIEMPENLERTELRDSKASFIKLLACASVEHWRRARRW